MKPCGLTYDLQVTKPTRNGGNRQCFELFTSSGWLCAHKAASLVLLGRVPLNARIPLCRVSGLVLSHGHMLKGT